MKHKIKKQVRLYIGHVDCWRNRKPIARLRRIVGQLLNASGDAK